MCIRDSYCSVLVDRTKQSVVMLASTEGGMDIEEVAANTPEKILKIFADPSLGLLPYQASELAYGLGIDQINPKLLRPASKLFSSLIKPLSMRIAAWSRSIPWFLPTTTGWWPSMPNSALMITLYSDTVTILT